MTFEQKIEQIKANMKNVAEIVSLQDQIKNLTIDRDEWKEQHENLLAIYQAQLVSSYDYKKRLNEALEKINKIQEIVK